MNTSTNSDFAFAFQESKAAEEQAEVFEDNLEFGEGAEDFSDKSEVVIFTSTYQIRGKIALIPGARLTDYIVSANLFIAVADVEVRDREGKLILSAPFLDIHRDHIELILPADVAKFPGMNT